MRPALIVSIALIATLFVFVVQNTKTVDIAFLLWRVEMSRALLLILVFIAGALTSWLLQIAIRRRRRAS
ncbi:MAG: LapA family protein [Pseudomonadota bacterium]